LLDIQVGLLINFHVVQLKDGVKRIVNNYREPPDDGDEQGCELAQRKASF
jgi:hypothetical protein